MDTIMKVESSIFKEQDGAPAESVSVTGPGIGGKSDEAELYQHPGILSRPDSEEICAVIEVGEQKIIIGTQNYKIGKSIDKGELFIYSVVDGVVKSSILLNKDGELIVNEGTKEAARKNDQIKSTGVEDATFWSWVTTVSAALNALVPGSVPTVPTSLTGKITQGTDKFKLP